MKCPIIERAEKAELTALPKLMGVDSPTAGNSVMLVCRSSDDVAKWTAALAKYQELSQ